MKVCLVSFSINEIMPLHKAVNAMDEKTKIQHNKLMKLDDTVLMYGIYNAESVREINQNCT